MWWYYKLIEKTPAYYRYAYSRESRKADGEIIYYLNTEKAIVTSPCEIDKGDYEEFDKDAARRRFHFVVEDAFPEEKSVFCA